MVTIVLDTFRRLGHVNWALADQALVSASNFLTGVLLARYLGVESFGVFALCWMVVLLINSIQFALISSPMMSLSPKFQGEDLPSYYGAVLIQQIMFSVLNVLLLTVCILVADRIFPNLSLGTFTWPLVVAAALFQMQDFLRRYLFSCAKAITAFLNDTLSYGGRLFVLVALIYFENLHAENALWAIAASSGIALFIGTRTFRVVQFNSSDFLKFVRRNWQFSKWLTGSALLHWISGNIFLIAAGVLLGPGIVGALRAAQNVAGLSHVLYLALENIVPMRASKTLARHGVSAMTSYLTRTTYISSLVVLPFLLGVFLFPKFLLETVYGTMYSEYSYVLQWYAFFYLLMFLVIPFRIGLRALEHTKPIFLGYLFMGVLSMVLCVPLILILGEQGALIGMVMTMGILLFVVSRTYFLRVRTNSVST